MSTPAAAASHALNGLSQLLQLEQQARHAQGEQALAFIMVNDTRLLLPYRQAFLWNAGSQRLQAVSGLAVVEHDAPFNVWLREQCQGWQDAAQGTQIRFLSRDELAGEARQHWDEHLPAHLAWLPLRRPDASPLGALLLAGEAPPTQAQLGLLELLLDAYGHAWASLLGKPKPTLLKHNRRRIGWLAGAAAVVILALPVRQSVLAPAEIVALHPSVLRAPLQGVVERILVQPNEVVQVGQPLAVLDAREMQSRLESSRQALAVADGEFRQAQQQALSDDRSKASLAVLQGRREQAQSEVDYLQANLQRMTIVAPRAGVAVFDDPSDWVGRPVSLGERIMSVAQPDEAQLEIHLPVSDAISLEPGAEVKLFLNTAPASPLEANLKRLSYRASPTAEGSMAYRLKADFEGSDPLIRVGLKGTAKLYGERTSLFYYVMRRPLSALRIWLAL